MGLKQYQGDMEQCCRCSTCKFVPMQKIKGLTYANVCPSIAKYNFHAYSGGGRLNIGAAMLAKKGFKYTDTLLDIVYNCQMCGACGVSCNYAMDMEVMEPINEIRIKCVTDGKTNPALNKVIRNLRREGSMVPVNGKRGDWARGLKLKNALKEKVDVLFHVGCLSSYDPASQKNAKAIARILKKAKVNFGIAGNNETCCGGRAYQMGYEKDFIRQAKKNMTMIRKAGIKTLVTGCADGYHAFNVLYDKYNLKEGLEVLHITEFINRLVKEGRLKLKKNLDMTVTYHDPCRLGRLGEPWIHWEGTKIPGDQFVYDPPKIYRRGSNGIYDAPRDLLGAIPGVRISEMQRIKEYAWCCGSGGGVNESNPEFTRWTALERIDEALSTGAVNLVSACPWCEKTFKEAAAEADSAIKVYDIIELIASSI